MQQLPAAAAAVVAPLPCVVLRAVSCVAYLMHFMLLNAVILAHDAWTRWRSPHDAEAELARAVASPSVEICPIGGFGPRKGVAVVTGGNSGIGFETAFHLARAGLRVILACRSETRGREAVLALGRRLGRAGGGNVEFVQCDMASFASIAAFAKHLRERDTNLKLLVCNAGVMATDFAVTADGFEQQLGVNHLGHALLVRLLMPLMQAKGPGRIVFVGSKAMWRGWVAESHFRCYETAAAVREAARSWRYNKYQAYRNAKYANYLHALNLAVDLQAHHNAACPDRAITVLCFHPGCAQTAIVANSGLPLGNYLPHAVARMLMIPVTLSASYAVRLCLSVEFDSGRGCGSYHDMMCEASSSWMARRTDEMFMREELWHCTDAALTAAAPFL